MPRSVRVRSSRSSVRRRRCAVVSTRSVVERGAAGPETGAGSATGAIPMTGMPTGEVEVDSAEGAEDMEGAEAAEGSGGAGSCRATAVAGSPGGSGCIEAWSRSPAGGGEPGAASVMTSILGGEPGRTLLRRKEPRGGVGVFKVVCSTNQGALSWCWFETQTPVDEEIHHECGH